MSPPETPMQAYRAACRRLVEARKVCSELYETSKELASRRLQIQSQIEANQTRVNTACAESGKAADAEREAGKLLLASISQQCASDDLF